MAKKKKSTKPPVDKHEAFLRVVVPRVRKALKAIGLIGNQAGAAYEPRGSEVADIFAALRKKVDMTEKRYLNKTATEEDFTLD